MTWYVLWRQIDPDNGEYYKITVNQEEKDYPRTNPYFIGQYDSLYELRTLHKDVVKCDNCGKKLDTDNRMYIQLSTCTCGECMRQENVANQL